MPQRRSRTTPPKFVVDQAGEPLQVGGNCGLYIDLDPDVPAPMRGDWLITRAGSRYLVDQAIVVRRTKHAQTKRYRLRCLRLPKHAVPPDDVRVISLTWYPRARS